MKATDIKFKAQRFDSEDYVEGHYFVAPLTDENSGTDPEVGWYFLTGETRHCIERNGVVYVIKPETLTVNLSLTPAVKESEKPITAEEVLDRNGFDFAAFEFENENSAKNLLSAMEEYASLRTVKESLTIEPMTAEEFLAKRNYDPTLAYPHILVVQLMEEYASKPTGEERYLPEDYNIQSEVAKIHHQYGITELANYRIEQLFEKYAGTVRKSRTVAEREVGQKQGGKNG